MHSSVKDRDKYGVFSQKYGQESSAGVVGHISSDLFVKDTDRCRVQVPSDRSKTRTGVECRCYWTAIEWTVSQRLRQVFGVGALVSQRRKQVWRV